MSARKFKEGLILKEDFNHCHLFYFTKELYYSCDRYFVKVFKHVKNSSVCDIVENLSFQNLKDAKNYFKKGRLL